MSGTSYIRSACIFQVKGEDIGQQPLRERGMKWPVYLQPRTFTMGPAVPPRYVRDDEIMSYISFLFVSLRCISF
jgi:hypothetical protein